MAEKKPVVHVADSESALASTLYDYIVERAEKAVKDHGFFSIGLSGGSLVKIIGNGLWKKKGVEWTSWRVFFCDERYVELDDGDSNFGAAQKEFLEKVPIKSEHVYKINPKLGLTEAADEYTAKIRSVHAGDGLPSFDLLLLGMGPDGHTCSLFPGHALLGETDKVVAYLSDSPKPPPSRITLTLPVVNNANCVMFVVLGASKAPQAAKALDLNKSVDDEDMPPAGKVRPTHGELHWFMDKAASADYSAQMAKK
eukprot:m.5489 g.5489  ORF g.5489 m.5489 type:complete len:254 (+) comp13295_c0_seq1:84-845(+)